MKIIDKKDESIVKDIDKFYVQNSKP